MDMSPHVRSISGLDSARTLRGEILSMAEAVAREPHTEQVLCLVRPRMTEDRLEEEWQLMRRVVRPKVLRRLSICVLLTDGRYHTFGEVPESQLAVLCRDAGRRESKPGTTRLPPPVYSFIVLKLFVYMWLGNRGPVTARWLADTAGCSYPTVASAVKRFGRAIVRRSDRRLELREFPRQEWSRLLTIADEARSTLRFADRSGLPRSPSTLLERLQKLRPDGVAIGGVAGARHHHPELDLMGLPRLDLSVHCPERTAEVGFVARLDPGIEVTSDPTEPVCLVVHFVRHRETLFEENSGGIPWADPVECLLDLHEARLESQAAEFVRALKARG